MSTGHAPFPTFAHASGAADMLNLFDELQKVAKNFAADAIPGQVHQKTAEHPIWPHEHPHMTDTEAIRLRMTADVLTARAAYGYVDQAHQLAFGWTEAQLGAHFIPVVTELARQSRLSHYADARTSIPEAAR
jgi:hypothetical protein